MSGSTIALATESVLVDEIPTPSGNHNGGDLRFGKDGYLYVSVGDGGCDYAGGGCYGQNDASRDQNVLIGKILRITSTGGIPPTNPFQGAGHGSLQRHGPDDGREQVPGDLRVGIPEPVPDRVRPQHDRDALLRQRRRRRNLGGGRRGPGGRRLRLERPRGALRQRVDDELRRAAGRHDEPDLRVPHDESDCHAITGGVFVPNGIWPAAFDGTYLYGDYTCGKVFVLTPNGSGGFTRSEFADDVGAVVNMTFGPSPQGQGLYYTNYTNGGEVRRIESTASSNRPPTARVTASPTSGAAAARRRASTGARAPTRTRVTRSPTSGTSATALRSRPRRLRRRATRTRPRAPSRRR